MKSAIEASSPVKKRRLRFFPAILPRTYAGNTALYNALVALGCTAIFFALLFAGSILAVLAVILIMFLTRDLPGTQIEMGWMAVMLLAPAAVFILDAVFCAFLLAINLKRPGRPIEKDGRGGIS